MQPILHNRNILLALIGGLLVGGALGFLVLAPTASRITLKNIPEGSTIYLDNTVQASRGGQITLKRLTPGEHTLLVARDGYWPWAKHITVGRGENLEMVVFSFPVASELTPATVAPAQTERVRAEMTQLPTREEPLFSDDESTAVWVEGRNIVASWRDRRDRLPGYFCNPDCRTRMTVFTGQVPIRSVSFYGTRNDVLLVAAENGIFGLELDMRGTQNFQPLYSGTSPIFSLNDDALGILVYDTNPKTTGFFGIDFE